MPPFSPPLDKLLIPITVADPGGEWLRYTEIYDAIQEARRADDPTLPRGIWERDLKKADWARLAELCEEAIQHRSKDLYLAVWLVEAWLHQHGVGGVAAGLRLLHDLCRDFWDDLYPRIDPDDPDVRAAPFEWLNDKLPIALGTIRISKPDAQDALAYGWGDVLAVRGGEIAPRRGTSARGGTTEEEIPTSARIHTSVAQTPVPWLRELDSQVDEAIAAHADLASLLRELAPEAPPSLRRIEEALLDMRRWSHTVLQERAGSTPAPTAEAPRAVSTAPPSDDVASMPLAEDGVVRNREEAYRLLSIAAEYLLRTEPHSPTPYLVQRAVTWGRMPLSELLEEYSQDGNDLRMLRVLLGLGEGH